MCYYIKSFIPTNYNKKRKVYKVRTLKIVGFLDKENLKTIEENLNYLTQKDEQIDLIIDSDGGLLKETIEIINKIENLKSQGFSFECHIIKAESAAVLFALVCDKRTLSQNAVFNLHIGGIFMEFSDIAEETNSRIVDYAKDLSKKHLDFVRKYIALTSKQFTRLYYSGNLRLKPEDLVESGFANMVEKQEFLLI